MKNKPTEATTMTPSRRVPRARWKLWALAIVAATVIGLIEGTQAFFSSVFVGRPIPWTRGLTATMPSWYVMLLCLPAILWVCRRFPLDEGRWRSGLKAHIPASVVYVVVHMGVAAFISDYVLYTKFPLPYLRNLGRLVSLYFVIDVFFYWAIVTAYHAFDYYRKYRERERAAADLQIKASRLETSLAQANLQALKMQLHPHFLFNTLNAVSVLAMKGERTAVMRMLSRLSELLRMALENVAQVVPLREELSFLERYLEIEQMRFNDRLDIRMDIPAELLDAEVPSMIMQPIVENAVRHGISMQPGPGRIEIGAYAAGQHLSLTVRDTGPGLEATRDSGGTGVGLANTRARLQQLYGKDQSLEMVPATGGGTLVTMRLPLRMAPVESTQPSSSEPTVLTA